MTTQYWTTRYARARYPIYDAWEAPWARRFALFFVQLLILTVLLHRFASLGTPAAMNLIAVSLVGLLVVIAIAVFSLARIWFGGQTGASQAVAAIVIALLGLAAPLYFLHYAVTLPALTEVETTPGEPLNFKVINTMRPADAIPLKPADGARAEEQEEAYPDIGPMALERSSQSVFSLVQEAIERLGWTVVLSEPPGETGAGIIEATTQSMIMGMTDDVIVQVKGDDAHAIIDVRSVSRYGWHDLGANAERIRTLYAEISETLEKGEQTALEQAEKKKKEATEAKKPAPQKRVTKRRVRKPPPASRRPQETRPRSPFGQFFGR
ncbi:MAG: DUF1499 domain-containing protein [Alphaproteobacteria bacterium]|nr:DUF1499 domain-containing protein [Alphaproteobacteria bacterium]